MTTTPKRKRGQHAKRHPWSNAVRTEANPHDVFWRWWESQILEPTHLITFVAGYRAGKDAK